MHRIEMYRGRTICQNEDGFFWAEGAGFETIAECRADIRDYDEVGAGDADVVIDDPPYPESQPY